MFTKVNKTYFTNVNTFKNPIVYLCKQYTHESVSTNLFDLENFLYENFLMLKYSILVL
ncbi:hypothetical protein GCM10010831_18510 [Psychroflexus salis]|uniref:Uncharacterized protein n=1 Tax=Psychroflexus salis TaxID=1526574 RepID=A0A917EBM3_9FLAO|nr:hypothetical protein GCM10010831_18510 [Psychroflexus salis]